MEAVTAAVDAGADFPHQFAYVIDGTVWMATCNETTICSGFVGDCSSSR